MSEIRAFLKPAIVLEEKEIVVSKRFKDGNDYAKWKIRPILQEQYEAILEESRESTFVKGSLTERLNKKKYKRACVLAAVVTPDLRSSDLCDAWGTIDPSLVAEKMLTAGEYDKLFEAIMKLSGFDDEEEQEEAIKK